MAKEPRKELKDFSLNKRKAILAILDPNNISVGDVAEAAGLKVNTIIKYCGQEDFIRIITDAKRALDDRS